MYNTEENHEKMRELFGADWKLEKRDEEEKGAKLMTLWEVQADVLTRLNWSYERELLGRASMSIKRPITKSDVLAKVRAAGFVFIGLDDIMFPDSYATLNVLGMFPIAVRLMVPDETKWLPITIKVSEAKLNEAKQVEIVMEEGDL
jgi:hypothetical protein